MLELGVGADIVRGIGWLFWGAFLAALLTALIRPKSWRGKALSSVVVVAIFFAPLAPTVIHNYEHQQRYAKAKALFDERCKTAGEKIYKTVEGVEGVFLPKIRSSDIQANEANPLWPEAGLPNESTGDYYIRNFLDWEHNSTPEARGFLNPTPKDANSPGYRYVDVKQADGKVLRYRLKAPDSPELLKEPLDGRPARYAVDFVNEVNSEDRKLCKRPANPPLTPTSISC